MLATITAASAFGLTAGVAGGIGYQLVTVTRLAINLVRDRLQRD